MSYVSNKEGAKSLIRCEKANLSDRCLYIIPHLEDPKDDNHFM
ncbi:MAG: hypothetical protein RL518_751 [Pseudomonadota bacterium]|jgi:hypothetical protein